MDGSYQIGEGQFLLVLVCHQSIRVGVVESFLLLFLNWLFFSIFFCLVVPSGFGDKDERVEAVLDGNYAVIYWRNGNFAGFWGSGRIQSSFTLRV